MKSVDVMLMPWKWAGVVLAGGTPDGFKAWAKKTLDADVETGSNSAAHAYVEYGKPWVIWVETMTDIPALAHEALHVAAGVLEGRGLSFSKGSEEAYTYTMEDILRQVLTAKQWKKVPA